ncbi:MAG TPA: hypothetical protein VLG38_03450 [Gammaproteobacteria bacterium]|nr:hypothetical protein [Gammaproteobacteria bacterium]
MKAKLVVLLSCLSLCACSSASHHAEQVSNKDPNRLTVGKVQKEIKVGMTSAEVVAQLGSPNIVTTDDQRREQWVYDKISSDTVYSTSSGGIGALILGWAGNGAIAPRGGYNSSSGAKSETQRTLTVIVKFDKNAKVRDFAYHNSSF